MREILFTIFAFVVFAFVVGCVVAFPIMWLWNWLMPTIFGLTKITALEAFGLSMLFSILLKSDVTKVNK